MTAPFSFPTINPGQPIMEPGMGAQVAGTLADVLAAQQKQQEQQYRMQQLAQQQAQQQALAQYYQGTLDVQNREQTRLENASASSLSAARQRGQALDNYYGVQQPGAQPMAPQQPQATPGNATQDPTAGLFKPILSGAQQSLAPAQGNPDVFGTSQAAGKMAQALQGVAPENVEGAISAIQATQPKEPELPTSGKEFQFLQHLAVVDPTGKAAQMYWQMVGPKPGVTVNNIPGKIETAYGVEGAKADVAQRTDALKSADAAVAAFPSLNEGYRMLQKGTVVAGLGSGTMLQWNRLLATVGVDGAKEKVRDTQTAQRLFYEGVAAQLQARTFGSGTAISENDRKAAEGMAGTDFSKDPSALKFIARINVGLNVEKIIGAKMLLEQQQQTHPEAKRDLQTRIDDLNKKLSPIWKTYQQMLADEAKATADTNRQIAPVANSLFPVK